jgi:hypothetical protein
MRASRAPKVRAILLHWRGVHWTSRKLLSTMAMTVPAPQSTTSTNSTNSNDNSNNPSSKQMSPHDEIPTSESETSSAMNEEAEFEVVSNMNKKWVCLCLEPTLTLTLFSCSPALINIVRNIGIPTNTDSIRIDRINTNPRIDTG